VFTFVLIVITISVSFGIKALIGKCIELAAESIVPHKPKPVTADFFTVRAPVPREVFKFVTSSLIVGFMSVPELEFAQQTDAMLVWGIILFNVLSIAQSAYIIAWRLEVQSMEQSVRIVPLWGGDKRFFFSDIEHVVLDQNRGRLSLHMRDEKVQRIKLNRTNCPAFFASLERNKVAVEIIGNNRRYTLQEIVVIIVSLLCAVGTYAVNILLFMEMSGNFFPPSTWQETVLIVVMSIPSLVFLLIATRHIRKKK